LSLYSNETAVELYIVPLAFMCSIVEIPQIFLSLRAVSMGVRTLTWDTDKLTMFSNSRPHPDPGEDKLAVKFNSLSVRLEII